jgi:predicted transcriptional regulator of viral defense system
MSRLKDIIKSANAGEHLLTDSNLDLLLNKSASARHSIVNKALKAGELIRIKRGYYVLPSSDRNEPISRYALACQLERCCYISLQTALSFHGWIPEQVKVVTCIYPGRHTKAFSTPLGDFHFYTLPTNKYEFLTGVTRIEITEKQACLMATPLRALMDYVYLNGLVWESLAFLTEGLRIELNDLRSLTSDDFKSIDSVYRNQRVKHFLINLKLELQV